MVKDILLLLGATSLIMSVLLWFVQSTNRLFYTSSLSWLICNSLLFRCKILWLIIIVAYLTDNLFYGISVVKNLPASLGDMGWLDPWVQKIPWRRRWQLTPIFLPGKSHGQRSLAGYIVNGITKSQTGLSDWAQHSMLRLEKLGICLTHTTIAPVCLT